MKNNTELFRVEAVCASIVGEVREQNEDNFCFHGTCMPVEHEDLENILQADVTGEWIGVFDGIGGLPKGELASYIAAKTLAEKDGRCDFFKGKEDAENYPEHLQKLLMHINEQIIRCRKEEKIKRMGCTIAALKFDRENIYGVTAGDSRIYRMRDGKITLLSKDHIVKYPGHIRGALSGYLGTERETDKLQMDAFCFPYQEGDRYLLCSDGVTDMLYDTDIEEILQESKENLEEAIRNLMHEVTRMGAEDNATAIIAEIKRR